ncbi:S-adenosyl-L-methionine-dependent methyltransferase [Aspergillus spinulosporus]
MARDDLTTRQWLLALLEPAKILTWAMSYYVGANFQAVLSGRLLAPFMNAHQLRDEAFGKFWIAFSSNREEPPSTDHLPPGDTAATGAILSSIPSPSLSNSAEEGENEQKALQSSDLIPPIISQATGVVLDVGPGTGTQIPLLSQIPASNIKAIYGAEPCLGLHEELRRRAADHGLAQKYTVLPCSVVQKELGPELERVGLVSDSSSDGDYGGMFDSIITVRVLCSVPDPESTISYLYSLLKPGGKLLVVEHVVNPWTTPKGSILARMMQGFYHLFGWRWVMGDCCLNRDTERMLRKAPERVGDEGWESVDLERWFERTCMVYVAGVFVKRR